MCFNKEVSLSTYLVGMLGTYQLYKMNLLPEAIFYGWVVQMQLLEFFLWKFQPCNLDQTITNTNKNVSLLANVVNHLEPFALWFAILYFSKVKLSSNITSYMYLFTFLTILYTYNVLTTTECTTVSEKSKPHLHWKWNSGPYYVEFYTLFLITLVLLSYYGLEYPRNIINAGIILISYIVSYYIYGDKHSVGAMWCFAAAFAPWVLIFLYQQQQSLVF